MRKTKKILAKTMAFLLSLTALFGASACMGGTATSESSGDSLIGAGGEVNKEEVTMISVGNFGGGVGKKWLEQAGARFAELKKNEEYTPGKFGVAFDITNTTGVTVVGLRSQGLNIFFLQNNYSNYFNEVQKGDVLDITDIVKEQTLAEYGENVTIESKIEADYRPALMGNDGNYYMLPHYEVFAGTSYDIDLFTKHGLYLAQSGKGTVYNCELAGGTYYFTSNTTDKTVGNDGIAGTDDDGMPTTLNELVAMCDYMNTMQRVKPFSVAGGHIDYANHLVEGLWTALAGYEQRKAVVSHTGTVDYVTGISNEEIWPGTKIYKPVTEKATLTGEADGYKAINQAGRYYAFAFMELAYKQGWFYERYKETNYTHRDAMEAFLLSGLSGEAKIAGHIEGSYWYNEAESYNLFEDYKTAAGTDTVKNIGYWQMPTTWGNEVVTGIDNARPGTMMNGPTSMMLINGNIQNNEGLVRACKDFFKFLCTEQELKNFTACTGVAKALFDYEIDDSVLSQLDPYQKRIMTLKATRPVVNQYGTSALYRAKAGYMMYSAVASGYQPIFNGAKYQTPLEAYYKASKNAWECFDKTGFTKERWDAEVLQTES